jgi:hypothetical protein
MLSGQRPRLQPHPPPRQRRQRPRRHPWQLRPRRLHLRQLLLRRRRLPPRSAAANPRSRQVHTSSLDPMHDPPHPPQSTSCMHRAFSSPQLSRIMQSQQSKPTALTSPRPSAAAALPSASKRHLSAPHLLRPLDHAAGALPRPRTAGGVVERRQPAVSGEKGEPYYSAADPLVPLAACISASVAVFLL